MKEFTCIVCPKGCRIFVDGDGNMKGAGCARGTLYVADELKNPMRMVTSTVKIKGAQLPRLPVKTSAPIPKAMMLRPRRRSMTSYCMPPSGVGILSFKTCWTQGLILSRPKAQA